MSKTPSSETAKTASAPKAAASRAPLAVLYGTLAVLGAIIIVVMALLGLGGRATGQMTLRAGTHRYTMEVAGVPAAQEKGLGGRKTMAQNHGMLFIFPGERPRCFWMKDMQFPLDIIWLNAAKEVVHIEHAVSPATYPDAFCPKDPARYVVELRAGQAARADIREGQTLTF